MEHVTTILYCLVMVALLVYVMILRHKINEQPEVIYICDREQCENCHDYCEHTSDITHAKNFHYSATYNAWVEKENDDE